MTIRESFVADLSQHLADDVAKVIQRHTHLAESAGVEPDEMAGILMILSDAVATQAIGVVAICAEDGHRSSVISDTITELARKLHGRHDYILAGVRISEKVARG